MWFTDHNTHVVTHNKYVITFKNAQGNPQEKILHGVHIHDTKSGKPLHADLGGLRAEPIITCCLSKASTLFAEGTRKGVSVWNLLSRSLVFEHKDDHYDARLVRFSTNDQILAVVCQDSIFLYDLATGKRFQAFPIDEIDIVAEHVLLQFSPNNRFLAITTERGTVYLWNLETGERKRLKGHTNHICSMSMNDDTLITAGRDWQIKSWDLRSGELIRSQEYDAKIGACFSADGSKVALISYNAPGGSIVDITNDSNLQELQGTIDWQHCCFSPQETFLATASNNDILVWDLASKEIRSRLQGHSGPIQFVSFSPLLSYGMIFASSPENGSAKLWHAFDQRLQDYLKSSTSLDQSLFLFAVYDAYQKKQIVSIDCIPAKNSGY